MNTEKFLAYFKKKSQSKDETDDIKITNVLTSVTQNVTSAELAYAEYMSYTSARKNVKSKFLQRLRKKLVSMQEVLVLLQQLKSSLLDIRNIITSEPQLMPGRGSAMMVTGPLSGELEDPTC